MAVLWEKRSGGRHYEVRSAGATRRLYTDGVFHSQFSPRRPLTGSIWDLLLLPAYFHDPSDIRRVLVLGVGGGTVIRQFQHFIAPECIEGVELNPVHLTVARRFFGVRGREVHLHRADAVDWLQRYEGPPFDLIVEDLFGEEGGEPVRAVAADRSWFEMLLAHLSPAGTLVMNFAGPADLKQAAQTAARLRRFAAIHRLSHPRYENAVGTFLRRESDARALRAHLQATPGLDPSRRTSPLEYHIKRLY